MDRPAWAVAGLLALTSAAAGILVIVGLTKEIGRYDSQGWYVAAGSLFMFGVLVWLWFFFVFPLTMKANVWRVRTLARAEAATVPVAAAPNTATQAEPAPDPDPDLEIVDATYGAQGYLDNVTTAVRTHVVNGRLDILVGNDISGGHDPIENVVKSLMVKYRVGGREAAQTFSEGTRAILP